MTMPFVNPGDHLQRMRRAWTDEFVDQHGRKFAAQYEKENGRPIGEFQCVSHNPPWLPAMRYIKWERDGSFRFSWDYEPLAAEWAEQAAEFYSEVHAFMLEHAKDQPVPEEGEPLPPMVLRHFKQPPMSPAIPLACIAGDPWILGVPDAQDVLGLREVLHQSVKSNGRLALERIQARINAKATTANVPLVPTTPLAEPVTTKAKSITDVDVSRLGEMTYKEFVANSGLPLGKAALAWKAHRENLESVA